MSDGDGILDGADDGRIDDYERTDGRSLGRGVEMLAADDTGVVLELRTTDFESTIMSHVGQEFDRLSIGAYIHGATAETARPEMPLKGVLVDIPAGKSATLSILSTELQTHSGYQVHPMPANVGDEAEGTATVAEVFVIDDNAYQQNAFYPQSAAGLGQSFVFRGQLKHQVIFYPLAYNPATGQMIHYSRIRVRVNFVDDLLARTASPAPRPWQLPTPSPCSL